MTNLNRSIDMDANDLKVLREALSCGNPHCMGGVYPTMPDGEPEQCRWCFEHADAIDILDRIEAAQAGRKVLTEEQFRKEIESWNGSIDDWERSTERKCYQICRDNILY